MIGTELLDDPHADPAAVERELRDITRLNALFGGTRAVVEALEPFFEAGKREAGDGKRVTWTLLDIGTGLGDIPRAAAAAARKHGIELRLVGIELNSAAARSAQVGTGEVEQVLLAEVDPHRVLHDQHPPVALRDRERHRVLAGPHQPAAPTDDHRQGARRAR